jgi:hypothetical protein
MGGGSVLLRGMHVGIARFAMSSCLGSVRSMRTEFETKPVAGVPVESVVRGFRPLSEISHPHCHSVTMPTKDDVTAAYVRHGQLFKLKMFSRPKNHVDSVVVRYEVQKAVSKRQVQ